MRPTLPKPCFAPFPPSSFWTLWHQPPGRSSPSRGLPSGTRAGQLPGVKAQGGTEARKSGRNNQSEIGRFLRIFGKPERLMSCDCERTEDTTLAQALQLVSGDLVQKMLSNPNNRLGPMIYEGIRDEQAISELWLAGLSRPPTSAEVIAATALLQSGPNRRVLLEDLFGELFPPVNSF